MKDILKNTIKDTLRLILFEDCNRKCPGCCNKDFDIKNLPVENNFSKYKTIILTGGEPMLYPHIVAKTITKIRQQNKTCKIIMYTAKPDIPAFFLAILVKLNGVTVTLHNQHDVNPFIRLNSYLKDVH